MNENLSAVAAVPDQPHPLETHFRKINAELEARVQQLTESNKLLEAFGYTIAHDLHAPLRWIDDSSAVLWKQYAAHLPSPAQEHLHAVRTHVQSMNRLIDDLLRFARLGQTALRWRAIDTRGLVLGLMELLIAEQQGRQFATEIGELPSCEADDGLLRQVWFNLLSNAIKFTRRCPIARLAVGSQRQASEVIYFVRDNGVGFDMTRAKKLFEPFCRLHSDDEFQGTGIGLATVQRIVEYHGGHVWADAQPDAGATFYFTLNSSNTNA